MGPYEYACVHSYMPWLTPMQMGAWPMTSQLTPCNSDCADETNENTNARKIEKRTEALASIQEKTDFPWLALDVREHPIAPNPHDLTITKRQWEKATMKYRHELIARAKEFLRRSSEQSEASNENRVMQSFHRINTQERVTTKPTEMYTRRHEKLFLPSYRMHAMPSAKSDCVEKVLQCPPT